MNEDLNTLLADLVLVIQDLDLSDDAKSEHINLIQAVIASPTSANIQALVVVLEALSDMDVLAINNTIDELKSAVQM